MICKGFNLPLNAVFFIILWIISCVLIYRDKLTLTVEVRWIIFFWVSIWTVIYIYSFWVGLFFDKYMVFTFPLLYISTAYMLDVLSDRLFGKSTLVPIAFIITMLLTTRLDASQLTYHGEKYDYKKLAECIHRLKLTKAERIFIQGVVHEKPLMYYYDNEKFFNNVQDQNSSLVFKSFESEHIFFTENIGSIGLGRYDFVVSTYPLAFSGSNWKEIGNFYIYFNHKTKG